VTTLDAVERPEDLHPDAEARIQEALGRGEAAIAAARLGRRFPTIDQPTRYGAAGWLPAYAEFETAQFLGHRSDTRST
jgi:hypothetical protein